MSDFDNIQSGLSCFDNFKCIASECSDNCCIGWEIDVDEDTLEYYNGIEGEFGKRLRDNIFVGDYNCFKMGEDDRCPFLNDKNLCDIIINLGRDKIPYICTHHPRFYEWLYDRCEMGIGICCPEAARLLYERDEKIDINVSYKMSHSMSDVMTYARETAFFILQNRSYTLGDRLITFLNFCEEVDMYLLEDNAEKIIYIADVYKKELGKNIEYPKEDLTKDVFRLFSSLEPVNKEWEEYIESLRESAENIVDYRDKFLLKYKENAYMYEHLAVYLTYRYFLKCLDDIDLFSKAGFIVVSVLFNVLMDIYSCLRADTYNRVDNSILYSKEVEYSQENIDKIYDSVSNDFINLQGYVKFIFN